MTFEIKLIVSIKAIWVSIKLSLSPWHCWMFKISSGFKAYLLSFGMNAQPVHG